MRARKNCFLQAFVGPPETMQDYEDALSQLHVKHWSDPRPPGHNYRPFAAELVTSIRNGLVKLRE